ncbi:hypothetical protein E0L36_11935 [Streptomyces sp. AJS327]|uniref:DALR anticodon-binding domain-containing protein n=1 Tax=Streptomyces sp. AJS327 TaxID=2545265 RepID=UPI0015DFEB15|nr:DALR anticodon-binding domain-containing protein [Streptomyces sp. AJS327]MBA0051577.1 hypothetical protein [Streptomyces sp. AJS327]
MTPAQLSRTVLRSLRHAVTTGELRLREHARLPERVVVESPPRRGPGDYGTGVAFQLAQVTGRPPGELAALLARLLLAEPAVAEAEVSGGGFLNVTLAVTARAALLDELRTAPAGPDAESGAPAEAAPSAGRADDLQPRASGSGPVDGRFATYGAADRPGADIARWAAATGDDPAALAVRTEGSSSLFRVQYAHSRARTLLRGGRTMGVPARVDAGIRADGGMEGAGGAEISGRPRAGAAPEARGGRDGGAAPEFVRVLALLADHRRVVEAAVASRTARHLEAVAEAFLRFQDGCHPLPRGDEKPGAVHRVRLALTEATATALGDGLYRLGVSAPARI